MACAPRDFPVAMVVQSAAGRSGSRDLSSPADPARYRPARFGRRPFSIIGESTLQVAPWRRATISEWLRGGGAGARPQQRSAARSPAIKGLAATRDAPPGSRRDTDQHFEDAGLAGARESPRSLFERKLIGDQRVHR